MKKSLCSLVALVLIGCSASASDHFAVSVSGGIMEPNTESKRLGVGLLGAFSYALLDNVSISLSSGYMTWGYKTSEKYNTRIVPIIFGARYYLKCGGVAPYACGELSYVIGETDWSTVWDRFTGEIKTGTKSISEFGSGLGVGIEVPVWDRLRLDVASMFHLTALANEMAYVRLLVGIVYGL